MKITTAACWNCKRSNPTHVLAGVRLALCPGCKALFPGTTTAEFLKSSIELGLPLRQRIIL
jgi:hypothetical protein